MTRVSRAFTLCASLCAAQLGAQQRELLRYELSSAEGRLLGFYSSALAGVAPGIPFGPGTKALSLELALELSYIPHLTAQQRTAGFDKPEASNLSPILPRPRLALAIPGNFVIQGSWLPPVTVSDARGNLYGLALSHHLHSPMRGVATFASRLAFADGRVEGAITCGEHLGSGSLSDQLYYANVCHAQPSRDYFTPRQLSADFTLISARAALRAQVYASVGLRREWTSFDIGVTRSDGSRDLDHPVLEMDATRGFGAFGLQWGAAAGSGSKMRRAVEIFYTPGSLATVRLLGGWTIN
jgi:hypothetical protein